MTSLFHLKRSRSTNTIGWYSETYFKIGRLISGNALDAPLSRGGIDPPGKFSGKATLTAESVDAVSAVDFFGRERETAKPAERGCRDYPIKFSDLEGIRGRPECLQN
jgi:hypothetical protein